MKILRDFLILGLLLAGPAIFPACRKQIEPAPVPSPQPLPEKDTSKYGEGTVVGKVLADGYPLEGVVVSDGYIFTKTDSHGLFGLDSRKKHGYVFISIPDGYDAPLDGCLPVFHKSVGKQARDTVIFTLNASNTTKSKVYVLGDMHLADKRRDLMQFASFSKEIREDMDPTCFALTLGDMTWDAYWDSFDLDDYKALINKDFGKLPFFHTIGNHDHDLSKDGDWDSAVKYKQVLGPTYYSFNRSGVHFVVLDDIVCTNKGGKRSSYNKVDAQQIEWLAGDLSYVDPSMPLVIAMHAPLYSTNGSINLSDGFTLIKTVKGHNEVYFLSGHTHTSYNTDLTSKPGYIPVYESVCGAVCGAWWYSVYDFPKENVHISSDGAPGGYKVLEIDNGHVSWHFKGTGCDRKYQFRTYDRNMICIDESYVPDADRKNREGFLKLAADFCTASSDNIVYINVWDWDPAWKIEVSENGVPLDVTRHTTLHDPLYMASVEAYSFNHGYTTEYTPGTLSSFYPGYEVPHLFSVKASTGNSSLDIKVTDRFGRTYTGKTLRPKKLELEY